MSLPRLIRQCAEKNSIAKGKAIHAWIIVSGSRTDVQINNHLLTMYWKLGNIDYAQRVFDQMRERNLVTWTSLISGYSQMGLSGEALHCFRSLALHDGTAPNDYTYAALISACAQMGALRCGKEIHGRIYRTGEAVNSVVSNCLVNFYGKCGLLKSARLVFDAMPEANTVGWVSLMSNYIQCGDIEEGLRIFLRSLRVGIKVNEFSYGSVLGACAALEILEFGMQVQCLAIKFGIRMDQFVVTNLVNFYAKCGELELASRGLREVDKPNVPAWTALIGGCAQLGKHAEAIDLFQKMCSSGLQPNEQTFASTIGAFGKAKDIRGGIQVHCFVIKLGFESFAFVSNSVLDFYAKIGRLDESLKIFRGMDGRNTVSWNALIAGCASSGHHEAAIKVIQDMFTDGFEPNIYTYSSMLSICGDLPAAKWGKQTHCCIIKLGLDSSVVVASALVDMYAKCGRLNDGRTVFDSLPNKNLVSWNTMITSYAQHGFQRETMEIYDAMLRDAIKPNDVTFIGVLSACGHSGALEDAMHYFDTMVKDFAIAPRVDHVACMVSLLSRKGRTREAYEFIVSSKIDSNNKVVWRSLLAGCVAKKDLELAVLAAEKILIIDPNDTSVRVMLSNVYADSNMWNEASQVRKIMERKEIGRSWI